MVAIWMITFPVVALASGPTDAQILEAFSAAHDGFSVDEVLLRDDLRNRFVRQLIAPDSDNDHNDNDHYELERSSLSRLLSLRKAGKIPIRSTRRGKPVDPKWMPAAEIAARVVMDRHRVSTDSILVDPKLRAELQAEAEKIAPEADAYQIRKATLQLRKRRALRPELVLRVADWEREIRTLGLSELKDELQRQGVPSRPGVYLFRNAKDGYLYVGEAADLSNRLGQHVDSSDRRALADFLATEDPDNITVELHVFPSDSPAKTVTVRRAYESELIRSRKPKFNVRP